MNYLAVFVLLVLTCGPLVQGEVEKEVHDEAVVNTKRLVKHNTKISIPLIVDTRDPVNLRKRYSYCFQRRCRVPGMENGVKGWSVQNGKGYVVISGKLYLFYRCDVPKYTRRRGH